MGALNQPRRFQTLAVDLRGLPCLVVGGGKLGTYKAALLSRAGARITIVAPEISQTLCESLESGQVRWIQDRFDEQTLEGQRLIVAATDDEALNLHIAHAAERRGILCCNVSSAETSRVVFPAVHAWRGMTVAIHSDGHDCRRSRRLRDRIAAWLVKTNDEDAP